MMKKTMILMAMLTTACGGYGRDPNAQELCVAGIVEDYTGADVSGFKVSEGESREDLESWACGQCCLVGRLILTWEGTDHLRCVSHELYHRASARLGKGQDRLHEGEVWSTEAHAKSAVEDECR